MCGTISGTIHRFTYQTFFSRSVLSGVFAVAVRHSLRHKGSKPKSGGGRGCAAESACSGLRKSFWISKTDTLPFVKWTKRQGVRLFSSIGRKTKMQTNEMFAFWKGGATEQVRDGFLNKKAVANQCSPRRRVSCEHFGSIKSQGHRTSTSHSCRSFNRYSSQVYLLNRPWNVRSESDSEL